MRRLSFSSLCHLPLIHFFRAYVMLRSIARQDKTRGEKAARQQTHAPTASHATHTNTTRALSASPFFWGVGGNQRKETDTKHNVHRHHHQHSCRLLSELRDQWIHPSIHPSLSRLVSRVSLTLSLNGRHPVLYTTQRVATLLPCRLSSPFLLFTLCESKCVFVASLLDQRSRVVLAAKGRLG